MKKPAKKALRNKADKLTGAMCRSKGKCEFCGKTEELQWAHFITRGVIKLRYEPKNYACLCAGCHFRGHEHPKWFSDEWDRLKGKGTTNWLERESNKLSPITVGFYIGIIEAVDNSTISTIDNKCH